MEGKTLTPIEELILFIETGNALAEQGECLSINSVDVIREAKRLLQKEKEAIIEAYMEATKEAYSSAYSYIAKKEIVFSQTDIQNQKEVAENYYNTKYNNR